jgi:hypothetical protein
MLLPRKGILSNPPPLDGKLIILLPLFGILKPPSRMVDGMKELTLRGALTNPALRDGKLPMLLPLEVVPATPAFPAGRFAVAVCLKGVVTFAPVTPLLAPAAGTDPPLRIGLVLAEVPPLNLVTGSMRTIL